MPRPSSKVAIPTETEQQKLGKQLDEHYQRATGGLIECVTFGALVQEAEKVINRLSSDSNLKCPRADTLNPQRGRASNGQGLKGWLEAYTQHVTRATAYRFRDLAESVRAEFQIGASTNLYEILTIENPTPAQAKTREKIRTFVEGKSQRQLLIGIGRQDDDDDQPASKAKPKTAEEKRAEFIAAARSRAIAAFSELHVLEDRWKLLDDAQLDLAAKDAERFAKQARKWLATPAPSRAALAIDHLLGRDADTEAEG